MAATKQAPIAATAGRQFPGTTKRKAIAIDAAAVVWPLGKATGPSWLLPRTDWKRGWASATFSTWVVRLAPATTATAASASSGRPRQSAIAQAQASITSSGRGSPR